MSENVETPQIFTGLILVTGEDRPGVAHALLTTLAPFSVTLLDLDQILINGRLILTVLISLNPAHQKAIETDLEECAQKTGVDIASIFAMGNAPTEHEDSVKISLQLQKAHPKLLVEFTEALLTENINIEDINTSVGEFLIITFVVSDLPLDKVKALIQALPRDENVQITVL